MTSTLHMLPGTRSEPSYGNAVVFSVGLSVAAYCTEMPGLANGGSRDRHL